MSKDYNESESAVPSEKTLAVSENTTSRNAFCISSYGAYQAVSLLSPQSLREVFGDTNPAELREIADQVDEFVNDVYPEDNEGAIKDMAYKRQILLVMAQENDDLSVVTETNEGDFSTPEFYTDK